MSDKVPTPPQAELLSRAWFGHTVSIAEPDGYRTATEAACLRRGWLAKVPGNMGRFPNGSYYCSHILSPDGLRALAAFLVRAAGPSPSNEDR